MARALSAFAEDVLVAGDELEPYMGRYLAGHVAGGGVWEVLGDAELVDRLDPVAVVAEAFRAGSGPRGELPATVVETMVAASELATGDRGARRLTRALAAARLGLVERATQDPALAWARLRRVVPHLALTGHTSWLTAVAFGTLPDGQPILATAGWDDTVRLWDPGTGTPIGDPLTGHTVVCV